VGRVPRQPQPLLTCPENRDGLRFAVLASGSNSGNLRGQFSLTCGAARWWQLVAARNDGSLCHSFPADRSCRRDLTLISQLYDSRTSHNLICFSGVKQPCQEFPPQTKSVGRRRPSPPIIPSILPCRPLLTLSGGRTGRRHPLIDCVYMQLAGLTFQSPANMFGKLQGSRQG
jgi:hypothetical protein